MSTSANFMATPDDTISRILNHNGLPDQSLQSDPLAGFAVHAGPGGDTVSSLPLVFASGLVSAVAGRFFAAASVNTAAAAAPSAPSMNSATTNPASSGSGAGSSSPAWVGTLTDAGIKADMTTASADGVITYGEMLTVLNDVDTSLSGKSAGLSASQFNDLKTIVSDWNSGVSMSSYVHDVLNKLVNGDAANAYYTGGSSATALGNLKAGSSYTQVNELVGKWFLGADLPSATVSMDGSSSFTVTYQKSTAPLFSTGGPSINDINQGNLGDCYLLSSLADVAKNNPSIITSMIRDNGNNSFGVRFYVGGKEDWVTVNNYLPTVGGALVFNNADSGIQNMWVGLVEKAYAQLSASGVFDGNSSANYGNSFSSIGNGGMVENLLQEITNAGRVTDYTGNGAGWDLYSYSTENANASVSSASGQSTQTVLGAIVAALNSKNDISLCSLTDSYDSAGYQCLVQDHALSITGYDAATGNLIIRNPWGTLTSGYTSTYRTTFEASLSQLLAAGDTITIDNVSASTPTLANQTAKQTWQAGQVVSFTLPANTFVDPQGQAMSYSATLAGGKALPSWLSFDGASGTFSGTVPAGTQPFSIVITATDATGLSISETFQVAMSGTTSAPVLANQTANQTWVETGAVNFSLAANTFTDPQGSALTYTATLSDGTALPSWLSFNAATETFSGTVASGASNLTIKVTAKDAAGLSTSETFTVTTPAASAPVIFSQTAGQTWYQGATINFSLAANTFTDPQGSALTYTATLSDGTALPSWLKFNAATETFSGTVASGSKNLTLKVTAKDAAGLSTSETFTVTTPAASAPVVSSQTANQNWTQGVASSFSLAANTFTDPQGASLTYSATLANGAALPSWLSFNAATETFGGTAPANAGTVSVKVTAKDAFGLSASETFSIVTASKGPALANQTANQSWSIGSAVNFTLASNTFSDSRAMTYSAFQLINPGDVKATSWLRFDAATMKFSGSVASNEKGTLHLEVVATDSTGNSATDYFDITFKNSSGIKVAAGVVPASGQSSQSFAQLAVSR